MPEPRRCRYCQKAVEVCKCVDSDIGQGDGYHVHRGFVGGFDRPAHIVENSDEVLARFFDKAQPVIECAYCAESTRTASPKTALAWFLTHACTGEGVDPDQWQPTPDTAEPTSAPSTGSPTASASFATTPAINMR